MIDVAQINEEGESIIHYGAVRLRVNGNGNLKMTFLSLDNVKNFPLANLPMQTTTDIQPVKLANFKSQRAFLRIETTELDEIFKINRVVVFAKPLWSQFVGK